MIGTEIKCPRCRELFLAREEAAPPPGPAPLGAQRPGPGAPVPGPETPGPGPEAPRPGPRAPDARPQYVCAACDAPFTEDDILDGLAVKRHNEVYCLKHFRMNFPDECERHPGTKAITQCDRCGLPLCRNCVIDLQGQRLCSRCKRQALGELKGEYAEDAAYAYDIRPGLPWEQEAEPFMTRAFQTVKLVLFSPSTAYHQMHIRGGYAKPLLYALILGAVFASIGYVWQILIMGAASGFGAEFGSPSPMPLGAMLVFYIMAACAGALIGPFISAAILHVSLMIVKGANQDFECTYRVIAYANGSTAVFNLIPIAGAYIGGIWGIVVTIIGFSRAHGITGGKAALAYFLPIIVCGGGMAILFAVFFAAMMSQ
jgi:hypothetical protein